jgi:hypothetical protein
MDDQNMLVGAVIRRMAEPFGEDRSRCPEADSG